MASDPGAEVASEEFTVANLRRVRELVERAADAVGLSAGDANGLLTAVNEIAANAIMHGGGKGHIVVEAGADGVRVEIRDAGPGLPPDRMTDDGPRIDERPRADAEGGRGLWLARMLCPDVTFHSSTDGLVVRLFMPSA
jgi:anti-sigma regulatory factor (Ser/Thr protein kinase)